MEKIPHPRLGKEARTMTCMKSDLENRPSKNNRNNGVKRSFRHLHCWAASYKLSGQLVINRP